MSKCQAECKILQVFTDLSQQYGRELICYIQYLLHFIMCFAFKATLSRKIKAIRSLKKGIQINFDKWKRKKCPDLCTFHG